MKGIARRYSDRKQLVPFLLRRQGCTSILLREVRQLVHDGASLSHLKDVFDAVNKVSFSFSLDLYSYVLFLSPESGFFL